MTLSSRLGLPYLLPNQAQKHVTLNESLRRLDVLVQLAAESANLAAPPLTPAPGQAWIIAEGASDAWAGRAGEIACWQDGAWVFFSPEPGWLAYVLEAAALHVWTGTEWLGVTHAEGGALQNLSLLGVGTEADTENPFSAKLNKALWTARSVSEGGDGSLRYTLNKETAGDVLSLLLLSGWSGRAEIGLIGGDDLSIKVSDDGTAWIEALTVRRADGRVSFPAGMVHAETGISAALYMPAPVATIWRADASRPGTPRTYALSSASGTTLTLAEARAPEIFTDRMRGRAAVRVWNISKSPAQAAWVDYDLSSASLRVTDAGDISGWSGGETLRLSDPNPTGLNTLNMVALDISGYLQSELGAVFPQKGVFLSLYVSSSDGSAGLSVSPSGAAETAIGAYAHSDGTRNAMTAPLPTPVPSPISNSNLVFLREEQAAASDLTIGFLRILGVYV